ncbi:hypothetical protein Tco_0172438, partial [Tanacetum coccineum]
FNTLLESLNLVIPPLDREYSCLEREVGFVELFKEYEIGDVRWEENEEEEEVVEVEELGVEYFDKFPTKDELAYHKYLFHDPSPPFYRRCPIIVEENPSNLKIPCNIGQVHMWKAYIDLNSLVKIMSHFLIVEDISLVIDLGLSHVVLGKPFVEVSIVKFANGVDEVAYQIPHKIEQF